MSERGFLHHQHAVMSVDNSKWHAYIRYKSGGYKEVVPISAIKEKTSEESKEALEEAISSKAGRRAYVFPPMPDDDDSEPSSTAEETANTDVVNDDVLDIREKNKRKKGLKKTAAENMYVNLMKRKALHNAENRLHDESLVNELQLKIAKLQKDLEAAKKKTESLKFAEVQSSTSSMSLQEQVQILMKSVEDYQKSSETRFDYLEKKFQIFMSKQGNVPQHVLDWIETV